MNPTNELPEVIEVNGVIYRRETDYTEDPAAKLLKRITGVQAASVCNFSIAVWAITYIDSIAHNCRTDDTLPLPGLPF